jgi:NAD(P)-dependent dehydrogenase (short-subunit alcohol dehydrogenase family)
MAVRHVVITGAAGGIGRALVYGFADAGSVLLATDHVAAPSALRCDRYLQADLARTATRAMAVDLGPAVRVNAIEPAAIATEMLKAGFGGKPQAFATLAQCHPAGRVGEPSEVAQLALALADQPLGFLSGSCVALDGGIGGVLHDPA